MTKLFQEASDWSRTALGFQNWQRNLQRKKSEDVSIAEDANWFLSGGARSQEALANADALIAPLSFAAVKAGLAGPTAGGLATSNPVVILDGSPSPAIAGGLTGSLFAKASAVSTPASTPLCCGSCGYINCPTQVMSQGHTNSTQLAGQIVHSGSGADFVPTSKVGLMGRSMSDAMSTQFVAPLANWNTQLPGGGGETGTTLTGQIGILSGSVTTAVAPSASQAASSSLQSAATSAFTAADATTTGTAAATAVNPIVLENQKQGNPESEWGIDGAGNSNIEGFTTDISVNHGSTINFKIDTNSTHYRIDIYRLGYYGGMGARKVATIDHTGLQNQPAPLRDSTTGLVDAGNWAVSASWNVPADAVSGVYIAKLTRLDGTAGENEIPFIVRDDGSHSDVVFQTSDETWQAYNGWGGANLYGGNGPATGQGAGRAYAVSYNRPIATRGGVGTYAGPQDYLFGAEYAGISWLEQNGYDVSYMAGVDVDRFGSLLLNHKTYVDAGHDEYWSGQQRTNVEAARDAGVNLMFWSGNEVYWRTRWGNSISGDATAYRTLITYKETWANSSIDPSDQWTGTFRDPRFSPPATGGGNPENSLTGQLFGVDDVGTNLQSIQIPYSDADLRFWRNTSIANLQPGQTAALVQNYLGYEWDDAVDNGFDPAGLVRLSSTTLPVNTYLLDYGNTTGPGVSTHSLTLYRAPSGALVFGAGTVFWPWALSDNHDLEQTPTDPRVQQAMINLLADMGIQPGTLQSGLVAASASTDHTPPSSTINPLGTVAAGTIVKISGTAADVGGVVAGVEVSTDNGVSWYTAVGDTNWTYSWSPQVSGTYAIRSRAVDDSVNLQTPTAGITVTVTAPTYVSLFSSSATPAVVNTTDASAVELGVKFQTSAAGTATGVRFYKSSQDTGTHTGELWSSTGQQLATVTFNSETASGWQSATFSTPITLTPGQIYTVSYHTDVGHYSNTSNFFTSAVTSGPLTAPASGNGVFAYGSSSAFPTNTYQASNFWVDVMFNPSGGTTNQPPVAANDVGPTATQGAPVTITAASLISNDSDPNGDTLTVTAVSGATHGTVTLNVQSNPQNNTITFTPDATFIGNASFTYTVSDGHGGTASANVSLTVVAPGQTPVSLFSASSAPAGSFQDGTPLEAGVKFTTSVAGQITALKFYRSAGDTGTDILDLWSSAGANLASVAFNNTTASGWQTVALPTAITLTANTTYVASYHTTGAYVATNNFFTTAVTNGPLAASATGNGVYSYGGTNAAGVFPTSTWSAANYWADVVFIPSASGAPSNTAPTAVADVADATEKGGIANGSGGSPATGNVLTNDTDPDTGDTKTVTAVSFGTTVGTLGTAFAGAHGSIVLGANGTFTYTINESDAAVQALRLPTNTLPDTFNYTMRDTGGLTSTTTINVTIHGADDTPVLASQTAGTNATVGASFSLPLPSGTFTDVDAGDTLAYTASSADGTALPAWLAFNASTRTFSGTPTAANVGAAGIKVTATDLAGAATSESFNIAVSTTPPPAPVSLFSASGTPAGSYNDGSPLELGVKFTSSVAGTITGLKFYRSAGDTGTDILNLWSATGVNLANATFTSTSASGWQTVQLATPIAINANTTYLASYHTMGAYVASGGFFSSAVTNGPLSAPSSASAAGNGVYAYGGTSSTGLFPSNTFNSANYWADVVFQPQLVG